MNTKIDIHDRLLRFGIRAIKFCKILSRNLDNRVIADQLIRSATSVGANMQEADAASSRKDFINKVNISKKEIQETNYWLKIISGSEIINNQNNLQELAWLLQESEELIKIIGSILHRTINK
ncbi:MAG: four helix bundle protein [Candidatus Margulisbacteria bacterium]|nr:four helix bundle protein [Candidatus Margulisiibacteriota bacterium]